ncbi:MAG TPA: AMP-binding protein [Candidatus Baltobacteraceae bacterium]|nr:AMP-binding protein [Candidatus Baltobacteraceae bacterium]
MPPESFSFARDVIDRLAAEDRVGLVFVDEYGHRRDYYFAEIALHSQRYAGAMRAVGIQAGERVLLGASNTAKCLFALLALERLGAVAVPCRRSVEAGELLDVARRTGASAVVTDRARRPVFDALRGVPELLHFLVIGEEAGGWERLDRLAEQGRAVEGVQTQLTDPACVLEGTTYDHGAIRDAREHAQALLQAGTDDVVWCTLEMGSARWFANAYVAPWSCGAATVLHDASFHPAERLDLVRELDVTILMQPAEEYGEQALTPEMQRFRAPRLRRCLVLGRMDEAAAARWQQAMNLPLGGGDGLEIAAS